MGKRGSERVERRGAIVTKIPKQANYEVIKAVLGIFTAF